MSLEKTTKEIIVGMKGNLAYWALDGSLDYLAGYVAGKVDQAFYMETGKFEAVYEISFDLAKVISPWFEKDNGISIDEEVSANLETENFNIEVWYLSGSNDFDAIVRRK